MQEVTVVDTPGFNDPVPSRDDKARHLLKQCDVVLILSLTNQIMSKNDTEVIEKITVKDGIRELFVVASQFDNALFGGEVIEESDGDIRSAIQFVKTQITGQIKQVLTTIETGGVFKSIIAESEARIFPSSGICQSMLQTWEEKPQWDEGRKQVWQNLTYNYPDYFSDSDEETAKQSLALLGNIAAIKQAINLVKQQKDHIFAEKIAGFERKYTDNLQASKDELLSYLVARKADIESLNLGKLEKEIAALQDTCRKIGSGLKDVFSDTLDSWYADTRSECNRSLAQFFSEAQEGVSSAAGSEVRHWTTGHLWWKKNHSEDYTTVNTSVIKDSIEDFIDSFNSEIQYFIGMQTKMLVKNTSSAVANFWNTNFSDTAVDIHEINTAVRSLVLDSVDADIEYTGETSFSSRSGKLTDSAAEEFLAEARSFVKSLQRIFKSMIDEKLEDIVYTLERADLTGRFVKKYESLINSKKKAAEEPKQALEQLNRLKKELEGIH